jgi:hypothetical protein
MSGNRCMVILAAVVAFLLHSAVFAQDSPTTEVGELKALVEDDERFQQLMTEVWVLRDLLALQVGGNISAETKEFQALQDKLRAQREALIESLSSEQARTQVPEAVLTSGNKLSVALESFGVRPDSDLGRRLMAAHLRFNQALSAASLGSLCHVHPFRTFCPNS